MNDRALDEETPVAEGPVRPHPARGFLCGLAMGTADAVPGVSGGTIALILGIYDHLIGAIADCVAAARAPWQAARRQRALTSLRFLGPLLIALGIALLTATKLLVGHKPDLAGLPAEEVRAKLAELEGLLVNQHTAPYAFAFFFGLVLLSIREPWRTISSVRWFHLPLALVGVAIAVALSLGNLGAGSTHPLLLLGAGAVAISVMLLPGISGTLALLVLGMYQPVTHAISPLDPPVLIWFVAGVILGVIVFIPLLKFVLHRGHDHIMALLTGLMAGSLAALWPWKVHYLPTAIPSLGPMLPQAPHGAWWGPLLMMLLGAALILVVDVVRRRRS